MPAPVIVPRDKSLDQVLATDQVHMIIIGSSQRATELAELAGEVSDRVELGGAIPRCAVQVTDNDAVTPRCVRKSAKRLIPPSSRSSATEPSSAPSSTTARSTASISKTCSWKQACETFSAPSFTHMTGGFMTNNSNSNENTDPAASAGPAVRTPATAIMLAFANPPQSPSAATVATECSQQGFTTVGITDVQPADVIDFSRFDQQSCVDLGDAIVLCVAANGFSVRARAVFR